MITFAVRPSLCYTMAMLKSGKETRNFLLRGFPVEVADKLKVAASLHRKAMREYLLGVVEAHLKEFERKGITLTLSKAK